MPTCDGCPQLVDLTPQQKNRSTGGPEIAGAWSGHSQSQPCLKASEAEAPAQPPPCSSLLPWQVTRLEIPSPSPASSSSLGWTAASQPRRVCQGLANKTLNLTCFQVEVRLNCRQALVSATPQHDSLRPDDRPLAVECQAVWPQRPRRRCHLNSRTGCCAHSGARLLTTSLQDDKCNTLRPPTRGRMPCRWVPAARRPPCLGNIMFHKR